MFSRRSGESRRRNSCRCALVSAAGCLFQTFISLSALDAPTRLKKELDHILNIQGKIGELDTTVSHTQSLIKQGVLPRHCAESLNALHTELNKMKGNAEEMYSALNVNAEFPSLAGVSLTLVKKLFLLRELKASVQKKASHACFEFDKLDRAAGGKDMVLGIPHPLLHRFSNTHLKNAGTKMHQTVRAAMSKKTQSLNNAVERYNVECTAILKIWPPDCQIPKPEPLPTSLTELKACTTLMESVWVSKVETDHRWVRDPDVREGIRAMHKAARCIEERKRLGIEADNMLWYFRRRLAAVTEALCDTSSACLLFTHSIPKRSRIHYAQRSPPSHRHRDIAPPSTRVRISDGPASYLEDRNHQREEIYARYRYHKHITAERHSHMDNASCMHRRGEERG